MIACLLVDDDPAILNSLCGYLNGFGMQVTPAANAAQMQQALKARVFDIILLDVMLPDADGLELCQAIRTRLETPIIMLTARGDLASRVLGLEWGADDYLAKPFEPRELVARIHAQVRRQQRGARQAATQSVAARTQAQFGGWCFDLLRHQLLSPDGVVLPLSSAEYRLMLAFVENPARVLSRDRLIELTRAPGVEVNDRSIDLGVSRLRRKLGDQACDGSVIRTLRGEGYLFDLEVLW